MYNVTILIGSCLAWASCAALCARSRWLCPALFLLVYGYKDLLIGTGYASSASLSDPVLHVAAWSALSIAYHFQFRGRWADVDWLSIGLFAALSAWMILSLEWSRAPEYGAYKAFRFASLGGLAYMSGMIVTTERDYRRMALFLIIGAIPLSAILLLAPTVSSGGRATIADGGPLNAALAIAMPATVIIVNGRRRPVRQRFFLYSLCGVMFAAIIATGSRAFLAMPLLALVCIQLGQADRGLVKALRMTAVAAVLGFAFQMKSEVGRAGDFAIDAFGRQEHWNLAFQGAMETIWGHGCGDFGYVFNGFDARGFPHNFLLEAWYELGIVGLLIYLLWWLWPVMLYWRYRGRNAVGNSTSDPTSQELLVVFVATSLAILPHFDLADNRALYVTMGLLVGRLHGVRAQRETRRRRDRPARTDLAPAQGWKVPVNAAIPAMRVLR